MRRLPPTLKRAVGLCAALAGLLFCQAVSAQVASSTNFVLQQSTVNSAGDESSSTNYVATASLGQESTIGTSASWNYVAQSGFWSYQGSGLVPIYLTAVKNGSVADDVDLSWSGNNDPYELYMHTDPSMVDQSGSYLNTTFNNDYTDSPAAATLTCYRVYATAPGPQQPPGEDDPK